MPCFQVLIDSLFGFWPCRPILTLRHSHKALKAHTPVLLRAQTYKALDVGGSIAIHVFGAFYGLSVSLFVSRPGMGYAHACNGADSTSNVTSMIGTLFLCVLVLCLAVVPASAPALCTHHVQASCAVLVRVPKPHAVYAVVEASADRVASTCTGVGTACMASSSLPGCRSLVLAKQSPAQATARQSSAMCIGRPRVPLLDTRATMPAGILLCGCAVARSARRGRDDGFSLQWASSSPARTTRRHHCPWLPCRFICWPSFNAALASGNAAINGPGARYVRSCGFGSDRFASQDLRHAKA